MTPAEYKQFCESTYACPPGTDREEYLRLLLIEELGEVASLFAKAMRDGRDCCSKCKSTEFTNMFMPHKNGKCKIIGGKRGNMVKRFTCRCGAIIGKIHGPEAVKRDALLKELGDVMWCAAMLSDLSLTDWDSSMCERGRGHTTDTLRLVASCGSEYSWMTCRNLIYHLGFTPEEVALANVEKLKDRVQRGTIHGAGDER
jgi:NTP pyrophosphatase (non-canonical NTP hydrolase)